MRGGSIALMQRDVGGRLVKSSAQFMNAWFSRHKVDRRPGWKALRTPGYVAWQIWGGDPARRWVRDIMRTFGKRPKKA